MAMAATVVWRNEAIVSIGVIGIGKK